MRCKGSVALSCVTGVVLFYLLKYVWDKSKFLSFQNKVAVADSTPLTKQFYHGLDLEPNVQAKDAPCKLPDVVQDGMPWPRCSEKVDWLSQHWTEYKCYSEKGVNGSVCSFLEYLSQKENVCPPSRPRPTRMLSKFPEEVRHPRNNLKGVIDDLSTIPDFSWMVHRISSMENLWITNARQLFSEKFEGRTLKKKNIHLHLGLMDLGMGYETQKGGAMGELLQWSDLIASLYSLGHNITITHTKRQLVYEYTEYIFKAAQTECVGSSVLKSFKYDIVYTDIRGYRTLSRLLPKFEVLKCKIRVLDSFGTEAQFNIEPFGNSNPYGGLRLLLPQFCTMFPHSPDNSFLGFVVEPLNFDHNDEVEGGDREIALIYGKDGLYWHGLKHYLDIVREFVNEIHATVVGDLTEVPEYVINHGIMEIKDLHKLLARTKIFVGLGFPFEGPAPLEAIAHGAIFLNPKFVEPINKRNHNFFRDKPTRRSLRSQNPYIENYIGTPHSYTVDTSDEDDIRKALNAALNSISKPYLPYEFSVKGMLERVAILVERQNFCEDVTRTFGHGTHQSLWPPATSLIAMAGNGSCINICKNRNLVCEPAFFHLVNTKEAFSKANFHCNYLHYPVRPQAAYPAYFEPDGACCIQTHNLYFSCSDEMTGVIRLCPCRDFKAEQVSLCQDCFL